MDQGAKDEEYGESEVPLRREESHVGYNESRIWTPGESSMCAIQSAWPRVVISFGLQATEIS